MAVFVLPQQHWVVRPQEGNIGGGTILTGMKGSKRIGLTLQSFQLCASRTAVYIKKKSKYGNSRGKCEKPDLGVITVYTRPESWTRNEIYWQACGKYIQQPQAKEAKRNEYPNRVLSQWECTPESPRSWKWRRAPPGRRLLLEEVATRRWGGGQQMSASMLRGSAFPFPLNPASVFSGCPALRQSPAWAMARKLLYF